MKKGKEPARKYTTITIPAPLFYKIQEKIKDTGFSSVSDYATFILRETTAELTMQQEQGKKNKGKKNAPRPENRDVIEKLRALGYV